MKQEYSLCVKVAGVKIRFTSDMEVDICNLQILFKHHLTHDCGPEGTFHPVEIKTAFQPDIPDDARQVWEGLYHGIAGHRREHLDTVKKYISADCNTEYYLLKSGACITNDLKNGCTTCTLLNKRKLLSKLVRTNIGSAIILMIHTIMSYHRRYSLHAAAVVWNERAIIFTGKSGQGKSTLSTDLAAQGVGFLGDDIVFIYQENGQLRIASLLFDAKLYESSQQDKDYVDILIRYAGKRYDDAPLQAIACLEQTREGESTVEQTNDEDLLLHTFLQSANNIALQHDHEDWMTVCARVMELGRLYTFRFGDRKLLNAKILDRFYE